MKYYLKFVDLSFSDHKNLRVTCKCFKSIHDHLIFSYPSFKERREISSIKHLPIHILHNSQIIGFSILPDTTRVFILDKRYPKLNPNNIIKNPHITFIISLYHIRNNDFQYSNFLQKNVKLFTTNKCMVNFTTLEKYKEFTFESVTFSHIEYFMTPNQTDSQRRLIDVLYHLDIKRVILDSSQTGIQPELLMKFRNIEYLSSNIFEPYSIFPLYLCNESKSLEIINFQYNSSLRLSEF